MSILWSTKEKLKLVNKVQNNWEKCCKKMLNFYEICN